MEQRISVVTLGVADVPRARDFYRRLGWETRGDHGDDVAFFPAGGMVFALWGRETMADDMGLAAPGVPGAVALAHNVRSPAEVDAVLAEAAAAGAAITKPASETFWGGYAGCFADLDGHVWEVAHNPFWRLDNDGAVHLP